MSRYIRNGKGSAHTDIAFNSWQRHNSLCIARNGYTLNPDPETGKPRKCYKCRGSHANAEMRFHALATAVMLTKQSVMSVDGTKVPLRDVPSLPDSMLVGATFVCPLTDVRLPVADGQAERPTRGRDQGRYRPGNVILAAGGANAAREVMEHNSAAYVSAVEAASARVETVWGLTLGKDITSAHKRLVKGRDTRGVDGAEWVDLIKRGRFPN